MTRRSYANFEEKLSSCLKKDMRNLANFTRALESVKIGILMGSFCPKQKRYDFKIYRGVMTMKNNAKFEEGLICHIKTDMRDLTNFDLSP